MTQPTGPDLDDLIGQLSGRRETDGATDSSTEPESGGGPVYATVDAWVREIFLTLLGDMKVERTHGVGNAARWCPRWWAHPLALDRLCSLWRAWETLRLDPGIGLASWYRDHFMPTVVDLTGEDGPFRSCGPTSDHHEPPKPVEAIPMPAEIAALFASAAPPVSG